MVALYGITMEARSGDMGVVSQVVTGGVTVVARGGVTEVVSKWWPGWCHRSGVTVVALCGITVVARIGDRCMSIVSGLCTHHIRDV